MFQVSGMLNGAADGHGVPSHDARGLVSVRTDRDSDRGGYVQARGVGEHGGTRTMDIPSPNRLADVEVSMTDGTAHITHVLVRSGRDGGGQSDVVPMDVQDATARNISLELSHTHRAAVAAIASLSLT